MTTQTVPTDGTPDFTLSIHDGEHAIAEQLTKVILNLRNCPGAKYAIHVVTGFYSNDDVYTFELDVKGAIIDQSSAIFFARHFGISMGHNPNGPFENIKVPFKLFGGVEKVWHTFLDNTTAVQGAKAINYLLSESPKRPNNPNGVYDYISGVTNAPFPSLHRVLSPEMVIDTLATALATHPKLSAGLDDDKMIESITKLLLKELGNNIYVDCFNEACKPVNGKSESKLNALIQIFFHLNAQILGNFPDGFISLDNSNEAGSALRGDIWGIA